MPDPRGCSYSFGLAGEKAGRAVAPLDEAAAELDEAEAEAEDAAAELELELEAAAEALLTAEPLVAAAAAAAAAARFCRNAILAADSPTAIGGDSDPSFSFGAAAAGSASVGGLIVLLTTASTSIESRKSSAGSKREADAEAAAGFAGDAEEDEAAAAALLLASPLPPPLLAVADCASCSRLALFLCVASRAAAFVSSRFQLFLLMSPCQRGKPTTGGDGAGEPGAVRADAAEAAAGAADLCTNGGRAEPAPEALAAAALFLLAMADGADERRMAICEGGGRGGTE